MNANDAATWPEPLRVNAASIKLARALHEARSEAYCVNWEPFDALLPMARKAYIDAAHAILEESAPRDGFLLDIAALIPRLARTRMRSVK